MVGLTQGGDQHQARDGTFKEVIQSNVTSNPPYYVVFPTFTIDSRSERVHVASTNEGGPEQRNEFIGLS
ncbi:hypothetical protein CK203_007740 [Vitis vinifera]|uniref:Uncharacterized protein n=1 Tax=Vitis vinifera TaxID=29760 RepID=A0A438K1F2_VITVI|nr:hypothetical protein CK203_086828 [Vitis vinifera]RVX15031.1 hypothetical protein CK203_007740 [Vitis vinifera]